MPKIVEKDGKQAIEVEHDPMLSELEKLQDFEDGNAEKQEFVEQVKVKWEDIKPLDKGEHGTFNSMLTLSNDLNGLKKQHKMHQEILKDIHKSYRDIKRGKVKYILVQKDKGVFMPDFDMTKLQDNLIKQRNIMVNADNSITGQVERKAELFKEYILKSYKMAKLLVQKYYGEEPDKILADYEELKEINEKNDEYQIGGNKDGHKVHGRPEKGDKDSKVDSGKTVEKKV